MAVKNLEYYKQQVRKKFPSYTEAQVSAAAQSAYESDPESTYKKPKGITQNKNKPTFDTGEGEDDISGISLGFGTGVSLVPVKLESYVVTLLKENPKVYASIKKSVETVTGRKLNDPNAVGAYVAKLAENIYQSDNPTAKMVPIEDYLRLAAQYRSSTTKPKPDLSRSIYQYSPEQIDAKADEITRDIGGFAVTDEVKAQPWYKDLTKAINEMVMRGTVTTTKQVKNPKTGKIENVTIQKPEVTTEAITEKIKTAVMAADPISVERKQNLEFAYWAMKKMGGNR